MATKQDELRGALLSADPRLSKYDPMGRIIFFDDFDRGLSGWTELISAAGYPDPKGDSFQLPQAHRDYRPPMLSNLTMPDTGTHGALQGSYALKVTTRPKRGHFAKSLKRLTWLRRGVYQAECFFTFKPEPSSLNLGEEQIRLFGVSFDLQDEDHRYFILIRYLNALDGELCQRWQYLSRGTMLPGESEWGPDAFSDVPGGGQQLCYNETVTKVNWHYLRWVVDLDKREHVELQCNDQVFDMRGSGPIMRPATSTLRGLLNLGFFVEADADVRCSLLVDSVLLSTGR